MFHVPITEANDPCSCVYPESHSHSHCTSQAVSMTVQSVQLILKGLQKAARGKPCDCNTREYYSCFSRAFQLSLSGTMGQNSHHLTLLQRQQHEVPSLLLAEGLELDDLLSPFQPELFCDSMKPN